MKHQEKETAPWPGSQCDQVVRYSLTGNRARGSAAGKSPERSAYISKGLQVIHKRKDYRSSLKIPTSVWKLFVRCLLSGSDGQWSMTMTKSGDTQSIQRLGLFRFVVLRVLVHGYVASQLLNLVRQYVTVGAHGRSRAAHHTRGQKQRERGRAKPY